MSSEILREFEPLAARAAREAITATVAVMDKKIRVLEGAKLAPRGIKNALHMGLIDPEMQGLLDDPDLKPLLNGHVLRREEIGAIIKGIERRREECISLAHNEDPKQALLVRHINGESILLEAEIQQILELTDEREVLLALENPDEAPVEDGAAAEFYRRQQIAWEQANATRALTRDKAKRAIGILANKARQSRSPNRHQPDAENRKPRPNIVNQPPEKELTEDENASIELIQELQRNPEKFQELRDVGLHEDDIKRLQDQVNALEDVEATENQRKIREAQLEQVRTEIKEQWSSIRKTVVARMSPPSPFLAPGMITFGFSDFLEKSLTHLARLMREVRMLSQETTGRENGPKVVPLPPPDKPEPVLRAPIEEFEAWHSEPSSDSWPPQLPRIKMRKKPGKKTMRRTAKPENKEGGKKKGKDKAAQEGKKGRKGR